MDPVLSGWLQLFTILLFCFCLRDDLIKRLRLEHPRGELLLKLLEVRLCRGGSSSCSFLPHWTMTEVQFSGNIRTGSPCCF